MEAVDWSTMLLAGPWEWGAVALANAIVLAIAWFRYRVRRRDTGD